MARYGVVFRRKLILELKLTILGCGSAAPTLFRANSAQILEIAGKVILIDCGEGTQWQLLKRKISAFKIDLIFISHLHGDHYLGLPGLLNTLALYGRETPLQIFGPKGIKQLLNNHSIEAEMPPGYELEINEIDTDQTSVIYNLEELTIKAIPLQHRIDCYGYHFELNHFSLKLNKERCDEAGLGYEAIKQFKAGLNYEQDGELYLHTNFTTPYHLKQSYAYITDTLFLPQIAPFIKDTNILYHESTYLNTLLDKAIKTYHSTSVQAAEMAKLCNAGLLILGHFSSRYEHTESLLEEAKTIFSNSELAEDGKVFVLK